MLPATSLRISKYAPHATMASHRHDEPSLSVVLAGDFAENVAGGERHYASGCVSLGLAGMIHSQQFGAHGARQIIVKPQAAWLAYLADCKLDLDASPFAHASVFAVLGQRLLREMSCGDDFSPLAREGILLEIVAGFGRADALAGTTGKAPPWLVAARDFMHQKAFATMTLRQIAEAAGRHEIHLAREFRRYFGMSVGSYLRQVRTERAAHLLRHSSSDITEIALRCGFASHAHLCRVFKAHFGLTPTQYRTKH